MNYKPLIISGTVTLVVLSLFLLVQTNQLINTATTTNTVSFSGEGKVSAKPDIAIVDFSIVTQAATSKAAQDDNSAKSQKLTDFLKKQGIVDKDIKTTGYNIYPQYSYPRPCPVGAMCPEYNDNNPKISGYQVSQTVEVKIRDLDKASSVVDGAVTAGVNQVNQLQFSIENPEALKDQAREAAIKDAKSKADKLVSQLGIHLGRIVDFNENTGGYPVPYMMEAKGVGMGGGVDTTPSIPSGENEITVNITITYQIK